MDASKAGVRQEKIENPREARRDGDPRRPSLSITEKGFKQETSQSGRRKTRGKKNEGKKKLNDSHVLREVPNEVLVHSVVSLLGLSKRIDVREIEDSFRLSNGPILPGSVLELRRTSFRPSRRRALVSESLLVSASLVSGLAPTPVG